MTRRYIGGPLELDLSLLTRPPGVSLRGYFGVPGGAVETASGRGALALVLDHCDRPIRRALLPDFICLDSLLPVLNQRNIQVSYFPVTENLEVCPNGLAQALSTPVDAVLLVNYFGCRPMAEAADLVRRKQPDALVILDNVQALFELETCSQAMSWSHAQIFSPRKFLPVPDGGLAVSAWPLATAAPNAEVEQMAGLAAAAGIMRGLVTSGGVDGGMAISLEEAYLGLLAGLKPAADAAAPSGLSREITARVDFQEVQARRQENRAVLADGLAGIEALRPLLSPSETQDVPLGFPVLVTNGQRDQLRAFLAAKEIFCAVHWPLPADHARGSAAQALARNMLTLPLDQRYGVPEMIRIIDAIGEFR